MQITRSNPCGRCRGKNKMEKNTKILYCKKCDEKTSHLMTGYRRAFEGQWYRCKVCGEERDA
jgi:hypothetical protein